MQDFTSGNAPETLASPTAEQIGAPVLSKRPGRPKKEKSESSLPLKRGRKPKANKTVKAAKPGRKPAKSTKRGRRTSKDKLLGVKNQSATLVRRGRKPAAPKKVGRKLGRKPASKVATATVRARTVSVTLSPELGYYLSRQAERYDMDIAGYVKHLIIKDMPSTTRE